VIAIPVQEDRAKLIVMRFTRPVIASTTGSVLTHSHDGSIDHLNCRIMQRSQCIHDLVPDASWFPAHKAIATSR
jgi:hypothetical protein